MRKGFLKAISGIAAAALLVVSFAMPKTALAGVNVGAQDLSTGWWGAHTDIANVPDNGSVTFKFVNHSLKGENWQSAVVVLQNTATGHSAADADGYKEFAVCRVDNYGWGDNYASAALENNFNWDTFKEDVDGATFTVTISRKDGKANVAYDIKTKTNASYFQTYTGIPFTGELYTCLTVDMCWLENVVITVNDPSKPAPGTGVAVAAIPAAIVMLASGAMAVKTSKKDEQ